MNRILLSIISISLLAACNSVPKTELHAVENVKGKAVYGDSIENANIIQITALSTAMKDEKKMDMKIRGKVEEVCKKKGCWIIMKLNDGQEMRVTFKDYKIFLPKDVLGREVILDGFAYRDTTTVEMLQHYAKDGGKSEKEIADIVDPKVELAFEAKGVAVLN